MDRTPESDFLTLTELVDDDSDNYAASSRLKSKIYSALIGRMEESGPLLSVGETETTHDLCVFEKVLEIMPLPGKLQTFNACSICHARLLGESVEHPPIFWKHCPYVDFKG